MKEQGNSDKAWHLDNPAKSAPPSTGKRKRKLKQKAEKRQRKEEKKEKAACGKFGKVITVLQGLLTIGFMVVLRMLGIFPGIYLIVMAVVLCLLFLITYKTQKRHRGHAIPGKLFGILISLILLAGCVVGLFAEIVLRSVQADGAMQNIDVTNRAFSIYISGCDAEGEIAEDGISYFNMLAVIQPKTEQVMLIQIPAEYYLTLPGVSEGKRDRLSQASVYGMDTSLKALEYMYETTIPFYMKVDLKGERPENLKGLLDGFWDQVKSNPEDMIFQLGDCIQTNMTKRQISDLIRISSKINWKISNIEATGLESSNYTYSNPGELTYVITPDTTSMKEIIVLINKLENAEVITLKD